MKSVAVFGEVREQTFVIERYVTMKMIEGYLEQGMTAAQIALRWNAGGAKQCSRGTNRWGQEYDSCAYVNKFLAKL